MFFYFIIANFWDTFGLQGIFVFAIPQVATGTFSSRVSGGTTSSSLEDITFGGHGSTAFFVKRAPSLDTLASTLWKILWFNQKTLWWDYFVNCKGQKWAFNLSTFLELELEVYNLHPQYCECFDLELVAKFENRWRWGHNLSLMLCKSYYMFI